MRYGLLSDVHGNLQALRAAIVALRRIGVDRWIVAGDLVGYGAQPNECIEVVAELDAVCVAGNHDLITLGRLSDERCIRMARDSLAWTRDVLSSDALSFLAALPERAVGEGVVVAHGSLDDPQEYTVHRAQAHRQLTEVAAQWPDARVLVLGHTHRPWAFAASAGTIRAAHSMELALGASGPTLINPGAVGQSREARARARAGVLDLEAGTAKLLALPYDLAACRAALRDAGLPRRSYHLRPSPLRLARRLARKAMSLDMTRRPRENSP